MENIIDDVDLEMEADIPDPEHVVSILEGVQDSLGEVTGNEGLTSAQHYLGSVLVANGYIRRNQVGQEGFFSKVGDGAKAAIAYIKKMFQNIYEFFFKRDAPKLAAEAKASVKEGQEVMKLIETGGSTEAETDEALRKLRSVTVALTHQPDVNKAALEQILKEADEAMKGSQADKKKVVLQIGRDLPKLNKRSQAAIKKRIDEIVRILNSTDKVIGILIQKSELPGASSSEKSLAATLKQNRHEVVSQRDKFQKASSEGTPSSLKDVYTNVSQTIEDTEKGHKALAGLKTEIENSIKSLESDNHAESKKSAAELKGLLSAVSSMVTCGKEVINAAKALIKAGNRSFGY